MEEEIKKWWQVALEDLETSKYNLNGDKLAAAALYAQQSVEKGLKALQLHRTKSFEKTHDIVRLSILVSAPQKISKFCADIQPVYFESRYPDRADFYDFSDKGYITELVNKAEEVIEWIKKKLEEI